jgi:hypothetical protein
MTWADVQRQLTGRRLAVYDDLLRGDPRAVAQVEELHWLRTHRLARRDGAGCWHGVDMAEARAAWERHGATPEAQATTAQEPQAAPTGETLKLEPTSPRQRRAAPPEDEPDFETQQAAWARRPDPRQGTLL